MTQLLRPLSQAGYPARATSFTSSAGTSDAWGAGPQGVLVWADKACYVEVGVSATATTASTPIPANTPLYIALPLDISGAPWRVSAIRVAEDGILYAKPINKE